MGSFHFTLSSELPGLAASVLKALSKSNRREKSGDEVEPSLRSEANVGCRSHTQIAPHDWLQGLLLLISSSPFTDIWLSQICDRATHCFHFTLSFLLLVSYTFSQAEVKSKWPPAASCPDFLSWLLTVVERFKEPVIAHLSVMFSHRFWLITVITCTFFNVENCKLNTVFGRTY